MLFKVFYNYLKKVVDTNNILDYLYKIYFEVGSLPNILNSSKKYFEIGGKKWIIEK